MKSKKVIIRVDGNSSIGLGHIYRGIALAEMLKEKFTIEFVTNKNTIISPIMEADFEYISIPNSIGVVAEPEWFNRNYKTDTIIVIDGYSYDENYQWRIKDYGFKLVYIDDLTQGVQKADLVINHSPGVGKDDYKTEVYTRLALGLEYALLRKEFVDVDRRELKPKTEVKKIFIAFGGADPNDFSFEATKEFIKLDSINVVNVVLGAAYKGTEIFKINSSKLRVHKHLSGKEIFVLMKSCDLAIVPASTTCIELAYLGIPMMLGYFVENQENIYQGFVKQNTIIPLGNLNYYDFSGLTKKIMEVESLEKFSLGLLNEFKENPKDNILKLFRFDDLYIQIAKKTDIKFVFDLSNEPLVRSNSFNSDIIDYNDHVRWYEKQINDKNNLFYIIKKNNASIGQVRIKMEDGFSVIAISISDKYRGQGFASKSLVLATKEYFKSNDSPIHAYIKKTNSRSVRTFENAGFYLSKDDIVNNTESYIYKIDKK